MKRILFALISLAIVLSSHSQERRVQNRPYTDLREFHFGVLVGTHLQDLELNNVGPQMVDLGDGNGLVQKTISVDQDRWDAGFTVGVLGELRLNSTLQLRMAPAMYFGTRHLTFRNLTDLNTQGEPTEQVQELKTAYISCAFDLIAAAPRFNNHRPYVMLGLNPMLNLSGKDNDYIKLKRSDVFVEVGLGCDFYLPYFKLRPELKFMYSLTNSLDKSHSKNLQDKNMLMYTNSVNDTRTKMIALTFYFE
ncbi:PorT family protein [Prevotella sp. oral taxon 313]|uniref:type IX secretion/gliding motility protein PorT/SprT n=1 Tax=Prevotella TaxID=838 RepID=UPI000D1F261B|nr:porin family protein [Prevotella sp. oral taxon 313]PTL30941.1 PorT family protein [Prevotella sp. oral taxon 313]